MESRDGSHLPDRISYLLSIGSLTADERSELMEWLTDCSDAQFEQYLGIDTEVESGERVIHPDDLEY